MRKINILRILTIAIIITASMIVSISAFASATGVYNTAAVNLRSTVGGTSLGLVSKNATCDILMEQTVGGVKWYKVKITSHTANTPDLYNYTGWSQARYITTSDSSSVPIGNQDIISAFGSNNLTTGSSGNYVRNVQSCLANGRDRDGHLYYTGNIDGDFGPQTYSAVCRFQSQNGLDSDGIVGPLTKAKLFELYSIYCDY